VDTVSVITPVSS